MSRLRVGRYAFASWNSLDINGLSFLVGWGHGWGKPCGVAMAHVMHHKLPQICPSFTHCPSVPVKQHMSSRRRRKPGNVVSWNL